MGARWNPQSAIENKTQASCQKSRIVVDGLNTSVLNVGLLDLLRKGKVDSIHLTPYEIGRYGAIYQFVDEHPDQVGIAGKTSGFRARTTVCLSPS